MIKPLHIIGGLCLITLLFAASQIGMAGANTWLANGPLAFLLGATLCSVLAAAANGLLIYVMIGNYSRASQHRVSLSFAYTFFAFGVALIPPFVSMDGIHTKASNINDSSRITQQRLVQLFETLDTNNNGVITSIELVSAIKRNTLSNSDLSIVENACANVAEIGHVVDKHTHFTTTGHTMVPYTVYTYGISKSDLNNYPERMIQRYKHWQQQW